jgi:predicted RNA binding protein YcfA (HicA-like mRNA interferase family)
MKYPRSLSADDLIKALSQYGYSISRQKGSHIRLTTPINGIHHITIPNHNPLKIGTVSSILSDVAGHLGKTKEALLSELF